jgi:hypothetical protein
LIIPAGRRETPPGPRTSHGLPSRGRPSRCSTSALTHDPCFPPPGAPAPVARSRCTTPREAETSTNATRSRYSNLARSRTSDPHRPSIPAPIRSIARTHRPKARRQTHWCPCRRCAAHALVNIRLSRSVGTPRLHASAVPGPALPAHPEPRSAFRPPRARVWPRLRGGGILEGSVVGSSPSALFPPFSLVGSRLEVLWRLNLRPNARPGHQGSGSRPDGALSKRNGPTGSSDRPAGCQTLLDGASFPSAAP